MIYKIILTVICLSGCSSMKKTLIASGGTGAVIGATGGAVFSPNKESIDKNAYLFGITGALIGAGLGFLFYDRPKEKKLSGSMILEEESELGEELPLFDFSPELKKLKPEIKFKPAKKYEVPLEKLPKELEGKVKKQFIIEYESEARTMDLGRRTIQISPFKAWEHVYEK